MARPQALRPPRPAARRSCAALDRLGSPLPLVRMTAAMQNGDYQRAIVVDKIEDTERKSMHERAARAAMNDLEHEWILGDSREGRGRLIEKLMAESLALLLVSVGC